MIIARFESLSAVYDISSLRVAISQKDLMTSSVARASQGYNECYRFHVGGQFFWDLHVIPPPPAFICDGLNT